MKSNIGTINQKFDLPNEAVYTARASIFEYGFDFRMPYSRNIYKFEGESVHVGAPRNHYGPTQILTNIYHDDQICPP